MALSFELFIAPVCPFAHRAWFAAVEKGLIKNGLIKLHELSLPTPEWYNKEVNPRETVPAVRVNGTCLPESNVIVQLIDETFPGQGPTLIPSDPIQRARIRIFLSDFDSAVPDLYKTLGASKNAEKRAEIWARAEGDLKYLDKSYADSQKLSGSSGPYFLGADLSIADVVIAPFLHRFQHTIGHYGGLDILANTPTLKTMLQAVEARPAFQETTLKPEQFIDMYKGYVKDE